MPVPSESSRLRCAYLGMRCAWRMRVKAALKGGREFHFVSLPRRKGFAPSFDRDASFRFAEVLFVSSRANSEQPGSACQADLASLPGRKNDLSPGGRSRG